MCRCVFILQGYARNHVPTCLWYASTRLAAKDEPRSTLLTVVFTAAVHAPCRYTGTCFATFCLAGGLQNPQNKEPCDTPSLALWTWDARCIAQPWHHTAMDSHSRRTVVR